MRITWRKLAKIIVVVSWSYTKEVCKRFASMDQMEIFKLLRMVQ
jgi:hypothetical protein